MEYTGNIPHLTDFSICYWEQLTRFNSRETCLFSFCTRNKMYISMDCLQVWYNRDTESMGRYLMYSMGFNTSVYGTVVMKDYRHKTWNHFCLTYNKTHGMMDIYLNGDLQGSLKLPTDGIKGTDNVDNAP